MNVKGPELPLPAASSADDGVVDMAGPDSIVASAAATGPTVNAPGNANGFVKHVDSPQVRRGV